MPQKVNIYSRLAGLYKTNKIGWLQKTNYLEKEGKPHYCVLGGIEHISHKYKLNFNTKHLRLFLSTYAPEECKGHNGEPSIVVWNDREGRTKTQVVLMLKEAAKNVNKS